VTRRKLVFQISLTEDPRQPAEERVSPFEHGLIVPGRRNRETSLRRCDAGQSKSVRVAETIDGFNAGLATSRTPDYGSKRFCGQGKGFMRVLEALSVRVVGRGRTRSIRLALALAVIATLAGVVAATAGALAIDDASPCPAAYTEPVGEEPGPQPPFVCPGGLVGTPYAVRLVGRGGCEPYFRFTVVNGALPPGLTLSSSGLISGAPTQAGGSSFRVRIQDLTAAEGGPEWCASPSDVEGDFTIAVNPGVVVTTESAGPGTIGAPYNLALSAQMMSGPGRLSPLPGCAGEALGYCPLTWSIVHGQLPTGLRLMPFTGAIAGTPTAKGSSSFVVRATHDDGRAASKNLTITVRQPLAIQAPKPFAAPGATTLWEVGVPFAAKLAASGGTDTHSWSLADGTLPTGLALAGSGTLTGKPSAAGSFRATIRLMDNEGRTADYSTVFAVASRLAISTLKLRPGKVGRLYRAKLATTGGLLPKKWQVKSGSLPPGIRFDRRLGMLSGTPTRPGRYRVTFEATDTLKVTSTKTLIIDVFA
jgi:large repetitive protein